MTYLKPIIRYFKSELTPIVCLLLLFSSVATGQIAPPPSDDLDSPQKGAIKISSEARALAEDYISILEQLEVLTSDYGTYLAEMPDKIAAFQRKRLAFVATRLAKGKYYNDVSRLQRDLDDLQKELRKYRTNATDLNKDEAKVLRNLHRDIALLNTTFEFEILDELSYNDKLRDEITVAIEMATPKTRSHNTRLHTLVIQLGDTITTLDLPDIDFDSFPDLYFEITDLPFVSVGKDCPPRPQTPEVDVVFRRNADIAGFTREFVDSLEVPSEHVPILISNPFGDVVVSSWSGDMVLVRSEIEATAATEEKAEELSDKVSLSVRQKPEGMCIDFILPHLGDLGTVVTRSLLDVKVPMNNPVQCTNSFGKLTITDLRSSVRINAVNSSIDVSKVNGEVRISNSNGSINLSNLVGNVWIKNSNGVIKADDCEGTFTIENQYAKVTFTDCRGQASITNNGPIRIIDHTGDINLINRDGLIEVQRLDGNIVANTTMSPIELVEVGGSVNVTNKYGLIDISEVSGSITAVNAFAPIQARYLSGPFNLSNTNGAINVILTKAINGTSYIKSNGGAIKIAWEDDMDLMLDAKTSNGVISSSWPNSVKTIKTSGGLQTAQLTFGNADHKILISGDRSNIYLSEAR